MRKFLVLLAFPLLFASCSEDETITKPEIFLLDKIQRLDSDFYRYEFYKYDNLGRLVKSKDSSEVINPYVLAKDYIYDASGKLNSIVYDDGLEEGFEHQNGFLVKSTTSVSSVYYTLYQYDGLNRVAEIQEFGPFSNRGIIMQNKKVFTYDAAGNILTKKILAWDPITNVFELSATYTFEGYDNKLNPYFQSHNFPWSPVSRNNPSMQTVVNSQGTTSVFTYQHTYNDKDLLIASKETGPVRTNTFAYHYVQKK